MINIQALSYLPSNGFMIISIALPVIFANTMHLYIELTVEGSISADDDLTPPTVLIRCFHRKDMKTAINQKLIETGEKERLKDLLRTRLVECGWRDQVKMHCREIVKQRGVESVTVDDLVNDVTPKGRAWVPDSVKKELLQKIKTFLVQQANL